MRKLIKIKCDMCNSNVVETGEFILSPTIVEISYNCHKCGYSHKKFYSIEKFAQSHETTEKPTIYIKYNEGTDERGKIKTLQKGDWIDLKVSESVDLKKGEFKMLDLGVTMKLPFGYEALVVPRSSTFNRYGLIQTNGVGIIDETYCGNNDVWKMPVYATRDITIEKGTRVCQFRIQKHQPETIFNEVTKMEDDDRGGFGSTGE